MWFWGFLVKEFVTMIIMKDFNYDSDVVFIFIINLLLLNFIQKILKLKEPIKSYCKTYKLTCILVKNTDTKLFKHYAVWSYEELTRS